MSFLVFEDFCRKTAMLSSDENIYFPVRLPVYKTENETPSPKPRSLRNLFKRRSKSAAEQDSEAVKTYTEYDVYIKRMNVHLLRILCDSGLDISPLNISDAGEGIPLLAIPNGEDLAVQKILAVLEKHNLENRDMYCNGSVYAGLRRFNLKGREIYRGYHGNIPTEGYLRTIGTRVHLCPFTGLITKYDHHTSGEGLSYANRALFTDSLLGYWPKGDALAMKMVPIVNPDLVNLQNLNAQPC